MTDEELEYAINHITPDHSLNLKPVLGELFLRQQRIMKILQVHVTPQVMELILDANS